MTKEVIIVGAGPGGLASAILLAAAGLRVKILERLPIIGGRTSRIEADGFKFDLGHQPVSQQRQLFSGQRSVRTL